MEFNHWYDFNKLPSETSPSFSLVFSCIRGYRKDGATYDTRSKVMDLLSTWLSEIQKILPLYYEM